METAFEITAQAMEIAGVLVIVGGTFFAVYSSLRHVHQDLYKSFRTHLGRSLLVGLEFLVAADVIATVSGTPSMDRAITLGLIVLIRTFLSFSIKVELDGKLPWKKGAD